MLRRLLLINFILGPLLLGAIYLFAPTKIKEVIEEKASSAIQGQVRIQDLKINWLLPLKVELLQIQVQGKNPEVQGQISRVSAEIDILNGIMQFRNPVVGLSLTIENPELTLTQQAPAQSQDTPKEYSYIPNQQDIKKGNQIQDVRLHFNLKNANIQIMKLGADNKLSKWVAAKKMNLTVNLPTLSEPVAIQFNGVAEPPTPYEKLSVPINLQTSVFLQNSKVEVKPSKLSIFGFEATLDGYWDMSMDSHHWQIQAQTPDLTKIPAPETDLPLTKWAGQLAVHVLATKDSANNPWKANGQLNLQNFEGQVQWASEGANVSGPVKAQIQSQFDYENTLDIPTAKWNIDLTGTQIQYKDLFSKPSATPLLLEGQGKYQNIFLLENLQLVLGKLALTAKGQLSPDKSSSLQFDIANTSLNGLEKMFLPIQRFPLQGDISASGNLTGLLKEPKNLRVQLKDLKLRNVQGQLQWQSADKTISLDGPFGLNANASLKILNMQPKDTLATFQTNLTGLNISYKELFKKKAGQLLKADMKVSGSLNTENPMQSDLKVSGLVNLGLDEYAYKSATSTAPTTEKGKTPAPPPYDPSPFVESNPVIDSAQVTVQAQIKKVLFNDLVIGDLNTVANINKGQMLSKGSIGQIFNGSVTWKNIAVPLTKPSPRITGALQAQNVAMEKALAWSMPQWKDLAEGQAQVDMQFDTFMPSHPDFMKSLKANGTFTLQNGVMKTLQFQQMAAEQLAKIPGVGGKFTPKNDVIRAKINTTFVLQNGQMTFKPLDAVTPDKDQLNVSGIMNMDKTLDLKGNLYLSQPPVGGSFLKANMDATGRLQIPLMIKGSLLSPQMSFATETIKEMVSKTFEYEKNATIKNVKQKAQGELEKAAKDQLKKLFGK